MGAEAGKPAATPSLEEHVRVAAKALRALQPEQRPQTKVSLERFLRRRGCCCVAKALPTTSEEFAAAVTSLLADVPDIQSAVAPFAAAPFTGVSLDYAESEHGSWTAEPPSKRPCTRRAKIHVGSPTFANDTLAAAFRASRRLRHCSAAFCNSSLAARYEWLQSQFCAQVKVEPHILVNELVRCGLITVSDIGKIAYVASSIEAVPHSEIVRRQGTARRSLSKTVVDVVLGRGELANERAALLSKAGLARLSSQWQSTALQGTIRKGFDLSTNRIDPLKAYLPRNGSVLKLTTTILAPASTTSAFCDELVKVADLSILSEYSPKQLCFAISNPLPRMSKEQIERCLDCRLEVIRRDGKHYDDCLAGLEELQNPLPHDSVDQDEQESVEQDAHRYNLVATLSRGIPGDGDEDAVRGILEMVTGKSATLEYDLPPSISNEIAAVMRHLQCRLLTDGLVVRVDPIPGPSGGQRISAWPSADMLLEVEGVLSAKGNRKGKGSGKGKDKGKGKGCEHLSDPKALHDELGNRLEKMRKAEHLKHVAEQASIDAIRQRDVHDERYPRRNRERPLYNCGGFRSRSRSESRSRSRIRKARRLSLPIQEQMFGDYHTQRSKNGSSGSGGGSSDSGEGSSYSGDGSSDSEEEDKDVQMT